MTQSEPQGDLWNILLKVISVTYLFWGARVPKMTDFLTIFGTCEYVLDYNIMNTLIMGYLSTPAKWGMISSHIRAGRRIGPHNKEILEILIGTLLGDTHLEHHGNGYRFAFYQEGSHKAYLQWFHNYITNLGYANPNEPKLQTRQGDGNKIRTVMRFKTWTFTSFKWIHNEFYTLDTNGKYKKIINRAILEEYLSPLALAVWIMDDGGRSGQGLKIATNSFTYDECFILADILRNKYSLSVSIHKTGVINQYNLYILKGSIPVLESIIRPYLHPSMYYKLAI